MKAILVIDIPKGYEADQLAVNYLLYSVDGKVLDGDMGKELKPMPNKKIQDGRETDQIYGCYVGWNACIDEILGEEE